MASKPKFTHYRAVHNAVSFAGSIRRAGEIIRVASLDIGGLPPGYLAAIEQKVIESGNRWPVLEAGTMEGETFVSLELDAPEGAAQE